jgi:hypothetical protein
LFFVLQIFDRKTGVPASSRFCISRMFGVQAEVKKNSLASYSALTATRSVVVWCARGDGSLVSAVARRSKIVPLFSRRWHEQQQTQQQQVDGRRCAAQAQPSACADTAVAANHSKRKRKRSQPSQHEADDPEPSTNGEPACAAEPVASGGSAAGGVCGAALKAKARRSCAQAQGNTIGGASCAPPPRGQTGATPALNSQAPGPRRVEAGSHKHIETTRRTVTGEGGQVAQAALATCKPAAQGPTATIATAHAAPDKENVAGGSNGCADSTSRKLLPVLEQGSVRYGVRLAPVPDCAECVILVCI